jgi:hypothetical protein
MKRQLKEPISIDDISNKLPGCLKNISDSASEMCPAYKLKKYFNAPPSDEHISIIARIAAATGRQ